jgi:kynureninase
MNELLPFRNRFASLNNCCHLISNSLGAMPDGARAATARYHDLWENRGVRAWEEEWWLKAKDIGDRIGLLAGAPEDTVTMQANVTSASAVILSCFEPKPPRNRVVMVDMEFPFPALSLPRVDAQPRRSGTRGNRGWYRHRHRALTCGHR